MNKYQVTLKDKVETIAADTFYVNNDGTLVFIMKGFPHIALALGQWLAVVQVSSLSQGLISRWLHRWKVRLVLWRIMRRHNKIFRALAR